MPSAQERFRSKVELGDDHDRWTGARDRRGVGMVRIAGKLRTVQRAAWELAHGPLPDGARVQACAGERACVRIAHLTVTDAPPEAPPTTAGRRRRRGTGSVREIGPGKWRIVVTDPGTRPAARRSMTVHGTRADADAHLQVILAATTRTDLGDLRVRELVARHLDWRDDEVGSPDRRLLRDTLDPVIGERLAALLTPVELERALREVVHDGLPASTARDALQVLRGAYLWAVAQAGAGRALLRR